MILEILLDNTLGDLFTTNLFKDVQHITPVTHRDILHIRASQDQTPLHLACYSEDPKILEKILNKIDQETLPELLKIKDNYGCTPARLAYANTNQEIKNILNKKALKPS